MAPSHTRAGLIPPADSLAACCLEIYTEHDTSRPCAACSTLPTSQTPTPTNAANILISTFPVPALLPTALHLSEDSLRGSPKVEQTNGDESWRRSAPLPLQSSWHSLLLQPAPAPRCSAMCLLSRDFHTASCTLLCLSFLSLQSSANMRRGREKPRRVLVTQGLSIPLQGGYKE